MYEIHVFDSSMNRVGTFRCMFYDDAKDTFRDFIQCGYTSALVDLRGKALQTQYVFH